jgi:uncharacterized protein
VYGSAIFNRHEKKQAALRPIAPSTWMFKVHISTSPIHGLGVFADENIPPRHRVVEYTGERFSGKRLAKRLTLIFNRNGRMPRCIFRLNRYWYVDGEIGGCGAERINHSCEPNLSARSTGGHILLFSRRRILAGEELTLDYHYRPRAPRRRCHCDAPGCRGFINAYKSRNHSEAPKASVAPPELKASQPQQN